MVIVFQGDSITDGGRFFEPDGIGKGYVYEVIEFLKKHYTNVTAYNRGTAKNRSADLVARWKGDVDDWYQRCLAAFRSGVNDDGGRI